MKKSFWKFCEEVKEQFKGDLSWRGDRIIISDIEAVAKAFDSKWTAFETYEMLMERNDKLPFLCHSKI